MQKSVLITGCSTGGVGHALAQEYQSRGFLVFATARRLESMQDLEGLDGMVLLKLDVLDDNAIQQVFQQVEAHLNNENHSYSDDPTQPLKPRGLDILINNAGRVSVLPFADTPISLSEEIIQTNLIGPMKMTKKFLPLLLRSGDARIVCTGSASCLVPAVHSAYNASKAGLRSWCDTLRMELAPFNIHVIHLIMGLINTNVYTQASEVLPEDSLYLPIEDSFIGRRQRSQKSSMDVSIFAQRAVDVTLRRRAPREAIIGSASTTNLWANRLLPRFIIDWMLAYTLGLLLLASLVKSGNTHTRVKGQGWIDVVVDRLFT